MSHPLDGACEKLRSAKRQANEIDDLLSGFRDKSAYTIIPEEHPNEPFHVFRVKVLEPPPPRLSAAIGEFVHNIRSALNRIVWELTALSDANVDERDVEFPIFGSPPTPGNNAIWKRLRGIPDAFPDARAIIRGLQPYQRSDGANHDLLWLVHRLNGLDKYSIDHSIGFIVLYHLQSGRDGPGATLNISFRRLEDDLPIMIPVLPGIENHLKVDFAFGIQIPDSVREGPGTFFDHGNFQAIHQYASGIVLSFERFFL